MTSLVLPTTSFYHIQKVWRLHVISLVPLPYFHYLQAYTCLWTDIPASGDCPGFTLVLKMSRWTSHSPSTFFHRRTCLETRQQLMYSKSGQQLQMHETRTEFTMVLTSQAQISCHHWSRWRSGSSWTLCQLHPQDQSHHSAGFGMSHPSGLVVLVALSNLNKWIMTISNVILQFNQDMGWRSLSNPGRNTVLSINKHNINWLWMTGGNHPLSPVLQVVAKISKVRENTRPQGHTTKVKCSWQYIGGGTRSVCTWYNWGEPERDFIARVRVYACLRGPTTYRKF